MRRAVSAMTFTCGLLLAGWALGAEPVAVNWLEGTPTANIGVNFGVPWPKGAVAKDALLGLKDATGKSVAMQSWPLAYWPDGSLKWTAHALPSAKGVSGPLTVARVEGVDPTRLVPTDKPIVVNQTDAAVEVDTGAGG